MPEIEYKENVLKMFKEDEIKEKSKLSFRLVKWSKNPPVFEIRMFYRDKEGNWKHGKLRALDRNKLLWLKEHYDEVMQEFDNADKAE